MIRLLTIVGTLAMLLVAGGIFVHHVHFIEQSVRFMPGILAELLIGFVLGISVLFFEKLFIKVTKRQK